MSVVVPFRALRPTPDAVGKVASVPYDVVSTEEARQLARDNALSFLHVTRAEIDLPAETSPYDGRVYAQAVRNFEELKRAAPLVQESEPSLYFYRLKMGAHEQTGVAGCFSLDEYDAGLVKKHEKTRRDKEDDRTRHMIELRAQTGIVFLTYRASAAIDKMTARATAAPPLFDLAAPDGVRHAVWRASGADRDMLISAFAALPALYVADGHHRVASAARARAEIARDGGRTADAATFIATAFPDTQVRIEAYNRTVKDLADQTPEAFLAALASAGVGVGPGASIPDRAGEVSMYLAGRWHRLTLPAVAPGTPRDESLDVEVLQRRVLEPLLKVGDPRSDKRIDFVGGARGPQELERLVQSGKAAVAFSMFPVSVDDLMSIADAGGIMPPKSTWFEPKLRDGLLVHLI
jgi:uncharacterized protein (DUF1015 family)